MILVFSLLYFGSGWAAAVALDAAGQQGTDGAEQSGLGYQLAEQPVGLVGVFGAVIASSAAAVGALAASTVAAGVAVGVVAAVGVTGLAWQDVLRRRALIHGKG
ncbi:unnamed protein product [Prorocentrum cordatum]|uniref:Solute carrier family 40 protein n=1 Tax=Prorocentrum cordatum TaxID=2364126 RepID=A0ABN9USZ1_9DINO|nr:unnamed protein product [Polarella glacialis]